LSTWVWITYEPTLRHELVVVKVRSDRRLAIDHAIQQDDLDGGERQDDDRQTDPQRTQVAAHQMIGAQ
jgi:hypothetical protein